MGGEFRCALRSIILLAKHMTLNLTRRLIDVRLRSSRVDGKVFRVNCHLLIKLNFIGKLRAEQPEISYSYTFGSLFIFASFKFSSISATLYLCSSRRKKWTKTLLLFIEVRNFKWWENTRKMLGKCDALLCVIQKAFKLRPNKLAFERHLKTIFRFPGYQKKSFCFK